MCRKVTTMIAVFWIALLFTVGIFLATPHVRVLNDSFASSNWLYNIPILAVIFLFSWIYRHFPPPQWLRFGGYAIWVFGFFGIPLLLVSRREDVPLFLICFTPALVSYFFGVTVYAWARRDTKG